jgi:hypothetical protein
MRGFIVAVVLIFGFIAFVVWAHAEHYNSVYKKCLADGQKEYVCDALASAAAGE